MGKNDEATSVKPKKGNISAKVEHKNVFAALAAFQFENPTIARTKEFGKEGEKMHWWYSPLDEVLKTVRPLTAKHGLAFTWEQGKKEGEMVCALYHETYAKKPIKLSEVANEDGKGSKVTFVVDEENVIRSMAIKVSRSGDMKQIGGDSTYARRYTLGEVLGIAPDEDTDIEFEDARKDQAVSAMYTRVKNGIMNAKKVEELVASAKVLDQNMTDLKAGKVPTLGLDEDQLVELAHLVEDRKIALNSTLVGKGAPGENKDAGGDAAVATETNGKVPTIE